MTASLLTAVNSVNHAPANAEMQYGLQKRIESGEVQWVKKEFDESDLSSLGREEIGGFVDAVFVCIGARDPRSM
jgi:uroporphyrin-III C-methyltransferase